MDDRQLDKQIQDAEARGDIWTELGLRSNYVAANLPQGGNLQRGQSRKLIRHLVRLRQFATHPVHRADICLDLSAVFHRRDQGDPANNTEQAIRFANEAKDLVDVEREPFSFARACTALATLYTERAVGDDRSNLRMAEGLLRAALPLRPRGTPARDWAYTASNLAETLNRLSHYEESEVAIAMLDEIIDLGYAASDEFRQSTETASFAPQCRINAGLAISRSVSLSINSRLRRTAIDCGAMDMLQHMFPTPSAPPHVGFSESQAVEFAFLATVNPAAFGYDSAPIWASAVTDQEEPDVKESTKIDRAIVIADEALAKACDPETKGRAYKLRAEAMKLSPSLRAQATEYFQLAVGELQQGYFPDLLIESARSAGAGWADAGAWQKAEAALEAAVGAIDELYWRRESAQGRSDDLDRHPKLVEMLAYSQVKCGRLEAAVLTLERGRARALCESLLSLDPDLEGDLRLEGAERAAIVNALTAARSGDGSARDEVTRILRSARTRASDRAIGIYASPQDVADASKDVRPLVYVVSTPSGTASLWIEPGKDNLQVSLVGDTKVGSGSLVTAQQRFEPQSGRFEGLQSRDADSLERSMRRACELLGDAFGADLHKYIASRGVDSILVVPTGLLGSLPISAAIVGTDPSGKDVHLLDQCAVTITPSAAAAKVLERRNTRSPDFFRSLLAVADCERSSPERRLPHAEAEARAVASEFGESHILVGADADLERVTSGSRARSTVHFACHGYSDSLDALDSFISLADGPLRVAQLYAGAFPISARLVVLSACETAQYGSGNTDSNQLIGLAYAMLSAGASSVVASLAQVDDEATYCLMARFYRELASLATYPDGPARALRAAQLWLRSASRQDIAMLREEIVSRIPGTTDRGIFDWIPRISGRPQADGSQFELSDWSQFGAYGV